MLPVCRALIFQFRGRACASSVLMITNGSFLQPLLPVKFPPRTSEESPTRYAFSRRPWAQESLHTELAHVSLPTSPSRMIRRGSRS
jgi:hypothetical protein